MRHLKLSLLPITILCRIFFGCRNDSEPKTTSQNSDSKTTAIVTKQVDSLYSVYEKFDFDWIEFYADEFTAVYPDTPIQKTKKDSLKAQWERIYKKYDVKLISRGRPTIIPSEDMAISYNSFNEIFVNKSTKDTINNIGTYIINWKRQTDDTWKIVFETLQNN